MLYRKGRHKRPFFEEIFILKQICKSITKQVSRIGYLSPFIS
jgi:hypothetical protein